MKPRYRAWDSWRKRMSVVDRIYIDTEGIRLYDDFGEYWRDFRDVKLMQSTGLKDKNGKEVFVGDIIKCTRRCLHEVYIEKEYGGTFIGGMPAVYLKGLGEGYAWTEHEEIIGNIYENPELLEVNHDTIR